jgi:hypothetical protein
MCVCVCVSFSSHSAGRGIFLYKPITIGRTQRKHTQSISTEESSCCPLVIVACTHRPHHINGGTPVFFSFLFPPLLSRPPSEEVSAHVQIMHTYAYLHTHLHYIYTHSHTHTHIHTHTIIACTYIFSHPNPPFCMCPSFVVLEHSLSELFTFLFFVSSTQYSSHCVHLIPLSILGDSKSFTYISKAHSTHTRTPTCMHKVQQLQQEISQHNTAISL